MTAIVGVVQDGEVWMGGDSFCECGAVTYIRTDAKVFFRDEPESNRRILIGAAGDAILSHLAEMIFDVPARRADHSAHQYIGMSLGPALFEAIDKHLNLIRKKKWPNGRFLFGYDSHLYSFDCNGSLLHEDSGLMAIGWGDEIAIGALEATPELAPEERIRRALSIAAKRTSKVAPPFHIEKL